MTRLQGSKRAATRSNAPISEAKRCELASKGTKSQPVLVDDTQPTLPPSLPPLPPEALGSDSQAIDFELQLHKQLPKDEIAAPVESSEVATVAAAYSVAQDKLDIPTRLSSCFASRPIARLVCMSPLS
jgi:hypothetical protein